MGITGTAGSGLCASDTGTGSLHPRCRTLNPTSHCIVAPHTGNCRPRASDYRSSPGAAPRQSGFNIRHFWQNQEGQKGYVQCPLQVPCSLLSSYRGRDQAVLICEDSSSNVSSSFQCCSRVASIACSYWLPNHDHAERGCQFCCIPGQANHDSVGPLCLKSHACPYATCIQGYAANQPFQGHQPPVGQSYPQVQPAAQLHSHLMGPVQQAPYGSPRFEAQPGMYHPDRAVHAVQQPVYPMHQQDRAPFGHSPMQMEGDQMDYLPQRASPRAGPWQHAEPGPGPSSSRPFLPDLNRDGHQMPDRLVPPIRIPFSAWASPHSSAPSSLALSREVQCPNFRTAQHHGIRHLRFIHQLVALGS